MNYPTKRTTAQNGSFFLVQRLPPHPPPPRNPLNLTTLAGPSDGPFRGGVTVSETLPREAIINDYFPCMYILLKYTLCVQHSHMKFEHYPRSLLMWHNSKLYMYKRSSPAAQLKTHFSDVCSISYYIQHFNLYPQKCTDHSSTPSRYTRMLLASVN